MSSSTSATTTPSSSSLSEDDHKFMKRIQNTLETVKAWDADPNLLQQVRLQHIPWEELRRGNGSGDGGESNIIKPDEDYYLSGNLLLIQRLCRHFQQNVMTWINTPKCVECGLAGDNYDSNETTIRGPETQEEKDGNATRVEVYQCTKCNNQPITTTFPRYNNVQKLLKTKQGRCGEYTNLFGLYCRAIGFETRYVLDVTDHVWIEVFIPEIDKWIMVDSCEGIINKPSIYEYGWSKNGLCYMIAISIDHVVDVTTRYTRNWIKDNDFQVRRRVYTSSEQTSTTIINSINKQLQSGLSKARIVELDRRKKLEDIEFQMNKQSMKWTIHETKDGGDIGRISGSLTWKQLRNENGKHGDGDDATDKQDETSQSTSTVAGFLIESFLPPLTTNNNNVVSITVTPPSTALSSSSSSRQHETIVISNVACAVGEPKSISVVVLDDNNIGPSFIEGLL